MRTLPIVALHAEIDARVAELSVLHADRLACGRGCHDCCIDDVTVFQVEADRIRQHAADVLTQTPHPPGACAFLDGEGACRIYEHRPYVCRTQGLPLRWIGSTPDGGQAEYRDICDLNDGEGIERLSADDCWSIGPVEERLAALELTDHPESARVALRDLFLEVR